MPLFPFSAIVGLERARQSLLLHAVEPRLGGVLLLGHRGCAKTTLARAFAELLPDSAPFVEVPLGATEDRLVGSVNAGVLVESGRWQEQRGLIEQANGGVLYIDEINLLSDHLADFLLDSAATGQHRVERDGIARQVESRYVLVGSMNPDEGDLRPQLTDRFAHGVEIVDQFTAHERVEIARRRLTFDDAPEAFCQDYAAAQSELKRRVAEARLQLKQVQIGEGERLSVAEHARELGLEGVRAELAVLRTARAAAAWESRAAVSPADIAEAWALCLAHRGVKEHGSPKNGSGRPGSEPQERNPNNRANGTANDNSAGTHTAPPSNGVRPSSPPRPSPEPRQQANSQANSQAKAPAHPTAHFPQAARPEICVENGSGGVTLPAAVLEWWQAPGANRSAGAKSLDNNARASGLGQEPGAVAWVESLLDSLRGGWRPLPTPNHAAESARPGKWRLKFRHAAKRPRAWFFLDASRSAGLFLSAARAALAGLAAASRGVRFNVLLLQDGAARWVTRDAATQTAQTALAAVERAGGGSNLTAALKVLRRGRLRAGGGGANQRTVLVTDGLVTPKAGEPLAATVQRLRGELRKLTHSSGGKVLWLQPPVSVGNRGLAGWFKRLTAGLPLKQLALGVRAKPEVERLA